MAPVLAQTLKTTNNIVSVKDLNKSYRRGSQTVPVLENITFELCDGEFLALMGPSGSGKSTLLNILAGIDKPDSGSVIIGGVDISNLSETDLAQWRAINVGFIFQFYNLMPVLTAFENVELPLLLTGLSRKERREHVDMALAVVNLEDRMDHYPSQLSGGQQQRVPSPAPWSRTRRSSWPTNPRETSTAFRPRTCWASWPG
jgi:putative ABC transport system ATP-binding protein